MVSIEAFESRLWDSKVFNIFRLKTEQNVCRKLYFVIIHPQKGNNNLIMSQYQKTNE